MNTITLNDWLKRALKAAGWRQADIDKTAVSPCLTLSDFNEPITAADAEAISLIADDGVIRTPFPLFRYWMQEGQNIMFGCAKREHGRLFIVSFYKQGNVMGPACFCADHRGGNPFGGIAKFSNTRAYSTRDFRDVTSQFLIKQGTFETGEEIQEVMLGSMTDEAKRELARSLSSKIKTDEAYIAALKSTISVMDDFVMPHVSGLSKMLPADACPEYVWLSLHAIVMRACYEYLAPYNFTAVVRPDRPSKSVEWIKAREHYTVIHRKHPANTVGFSGRVSETAKSRLSHSRRAHTRLLTSARYTFKRGLRVPVRASWVGPEEWKDTAGQVYQILVPVQEPALRVA